MTERGSGAPVIGVMPACGGAGASTLAAAVAVTAARAAVTVLVDGDRFGGRLDVLLGAECQPGARWDDLVAARSMSARALLANLVAVHGVALLSWGASPDAEIPPESVAAAMAACRQCADVVVVDLPRDPVRSTPALVAGIDVLLVVVPARVRAVTAASSVLADLRHRQPTVGIVVRDPAPSQLTTAQVASHLDISVVASYRSERPVAQAAAVGGPPVRGRRDALCDAARDVLAWAGDESARQ